MINYKGSKVKAINYKGNDVKIVQKGTINCWAKTVSATVNVSAMESAVIEGNLIVDKSFEPTQKRNDVLMSYTHAAQSKTISSYYGTTVWLEQNYPTLGENFTVPARLTGSIRKFKLSKGFPKPGTCVLTYQGNKLYDSHGDGKFYAANSSSPANASIDYIKQELTVAIASSSEQVIISLTYDRLNAELEYNSRVFIDDLSFWGDIITQWAVERNGTVYLAYWNDFSNYTDLCPYEGTTIWAKIVCNGKTYYADNNASSKDIEITGLSGGVLYRCQGYANAIGTVKSYFAQFSSGKKAAKLLENTTLSVVAGTQTLGTRPIELQAEDLMIGYLLPPTITKTLTTVTGVTNYYIKITNPNPVDVHCTFSWAKKNNNFMQGSTFVLGANATSNYYGNPCYDLLDGKTGSNMVTVYLKKTDGDWANAQINQSQSISEPVPTAVEETTTAQ